jgi:DNA modification methylase
MNKYNLYHGNCLDILKTLQDNSIDSIVTDPPYGLSFMGKTWDYDVPSVDIWIECLRVLKPGGHLLAFAGTRTQHRMAINIEDAGFEIRDMIAWVYGTGFPKSHNLQGAWQGWGTALKPAMEPITVARKPLIGTVAKNVLAHGTGALNIDGCRVGTEGGTYYVPTGDKGDVGQFGGGIKDGAVADAGTGRWPANIIHDGSDEVLGVFPSAPGQQGDLLSHDKSRQSPNGIFGAMGPAKDHKRREEQDKSAARFFYCAKASKADRDEGLEDFQKEVGVFFQTGNGASGKPSSIEQSRGPRAPRANNHPTVKPTDLMRYLCRLVTPPNGLVLDPFMGSGSTGKAAILEGFQFIGIELDNAYMAVAQERIAKAYESLLIKHP